MRLHFRAAAYDAEGNPARGSFGRPLACAWEESVPDDWAADPATRRAVVEAAYGRVMAHTVNFGGDVEAVRWSIAWEEAT